MFRSFVKYWIVTKLDTALIVAVNVGRLVVQNSKFAQKSPQPYCFTRTLSQGLVFGFTGGPRSTGLLLRIPGYRRIAKKKDVGTYGNSVVNVLAIIRISEAF